MDIPEINYLAVVLAVVASMLVGFVFYHPKVLGTRWMRAIGHDERSVSEGGGSWVYGVVLVSSFVTAWVLAGATWLSHEFYGGSFLVNGLVTGLILWVGFTAARVVVHDGFDPRGFRVTPYTLLNGLLTVLAMALVIGLMPPG
ncbi:DUF1761 domain-containing protein [Ornithinimicrobium tianjinense]|uniref:DUF1761 domain-containing protein n=1 Tax=Ornithinimicrobium tianjinense TaxID=1195761 RepID=A0A917F9N6_9MICO|nr:DUF1761 domain-containing protein [Ornithinimicrobium tianjinense]GGF58120.1 hypothetical protein GCM10011366_27380 [Ornithinimicrobium tianjinense]